MVLRMVIIIGFISMINPIQAQRMLGGEKGIQIAIGVPLNDTEVFTENYNVQLAITRNTTLGNYWKFEAGYHLQTFDYKAYQIPYELFNGAIGYFCKHLAIIRKVCSCIRDFLEL